MVLEIIGAFFLGAFVTGFVFYCLLDTLFESLADKNIKANKSYQELVRFKDALDANNKIITGTTFGGKHPHDIK